VLTVLGDRRLREPLEHSVWLGLSLGAEVILEALAQAPGRVRPPHALVLASCLLDRPVSLPATVSAVHLVYGAEDYVAYLDDRGQMTPPVAAATHARRSAAMIRSGASLRTTVHVLQGLGHRLTSEPGRAASTDAAPLLARLVSDALPNGTIPDPRLEDDR